MQIYPKDSDGFQNVYLPFPNTQEALLLQFFTQHFSQADIPYPVSLPPQIGLTLAS